MIDEGILNTSWKTEVTPEQSAEIQRLLFKHDVLWSRGGREIKEINLPFLFYDKERECILNGQESCRECCFNRGSEAFIDADDIIAALRKLEGDKTVSEETNDEGWIWIFDELPRLGKEVELVCDQVSPNKIQKEDIHINHLWVDDSGSYYGI